MYIWNFRDHYQSRVFRKCLIFVFIIDIVEYYSIWIYVFFNSDWDRRIYFIANLIADGDRTETE